MNFKIYNTNELNKSSDRNLDLFFNKSSYYHNLTEKIIFDQVIYKNFKIIDKNIHNNIGGGYFLIDINIIYNLPEIILIDGKPEETPSFISLKLVVYKNDNIIFDDDYSTSNIISTQIVNELNINDKFHFTISHNSVKLRDNNIPIIIQPSSNIIVKII